MMSAYSYNGSRNSYSLLLTAAKHYTSLSDQSVQSIRKATHKLVYVRFPDHAFEPTLGYLFAHVETVQNIFPYRATEQYRFLGLGFME